MEDSRFDEIARSLAGGLVPKSEGPSRRGVLASLLGLGAGLLGVRTTAAVTCPPGQVYRQRVGCVCLTTGRAPVRGICPCPRGQVDTGDGQGCLACRSAAECPGFGDPCLDVTCDPAGGCLRRIVPDGLPGGCATGLACYGGACAECEADDDCPGYLSCYGGMCGCETDGDCPTGHACINGGCFRLCQDPPTDLMCSSCLFCSCAHPFDSSTISFCQDSLTSVGICANHEDCPAGTLCSLYRSDNSDMPRLCTRPCCGGT